MDLLSLLTDELHLEPDIFDSQTILITGSGRGIGRQCAWAFAFLGGTVILAEQSDQGREVEAQIRQEGGQAHFIQTDVADPESVASLAEHTSTQFGPLSVLVNNAIFIRQAGVLEMSDDIWEKTMAVNLRGTFLTCRAFLPGMLSRDKGVILNMISTDAMPGLSAYIASKQGITGFSQSLALETHDSGVHIIPFAPGMVDTPGIRSVAEGLAPRLGLTKEDFLNLSLHAAYDGLMPPEHAAAAAVYLTHHLASEYHGQVVNGYEVLEKAGLLREPEVKSPSSAPMQGAQKDLAALLGALQKILQDTEAEFKQLPIFVRPMAKQGFKNKAGASLSDWQAWVNQLQTGEAAIPANFDQRMEALAGYYRDVPRETARFTRDEETLQQITALTQQRLAVIDEIRKKRP
jgi:NAD(P)-dependent dehydrogenase (short-subunit alcohol dehydrogenase family)